MTNGSAQKDLCFVLMPFGTKEHGGGSSINFNRVYEEIIAPAIRDAGLEPLRADEEIDHGIIHKPMFERLLLCEYAVADVTLANANVFYELGIRHAIRPRSTVIIGANDHRPPFDIAFLRTLPYSLGPNGLPTDVATDRAQLRTHLEAARTTLTDSPVYQLVELEAPLLDHLAADVFRERALYVDRVGRDLAAAGRESVEAVRHIEGQMDSVDDLESRLLIDLLVAYRDVKAWDDIVRLVVTIPQPLASTPRVRELHALALNRLTQREAAAEILTQLIAERGQSAETYGLLGRVYKDQWLSLPRDDARARGFLKRAIDAYRRGFEADPMDWYPGINALTLMRAGGLDEDHIPDLLPVVRFAVRRRITLGTGDYWTHATMLELAVLDEDDLAMTEHLEDALAHAPRAWQIETTLRNVELLNTDPSSTAAKASAALRNALDGS